MKKWKKKIALCFGSLILTSSGASTAATYTSPILSGPQIFNDGDQVLINGSDQFGIQLLNTGETVTTTGKLTFDFTSDLAPSGVLDGISLKNGGLNTLGTGSEITVTVTNFGTGGTSAIRLENQSGGATTSLAGSGLKIAVSGQGSQAGISGVGNVNLGSGSEITATSVDSIVRGVYLSSSTLEAENLTINASGVTDARGMELAGGDTNITGQNNSITVKSDSNKVYGIYLNPSTGLNLTFERVDINVEASAASQADTHGIYSYMANNHIDLGIGSTITTKNATGLAMATTAQTAIPSNSTFIADQLTITTEGAGAHGIQNYHGSTVTLTNSEVTTDGANAYGLVSAGGSTYDITGSEINAKGANSVGIYITELSNVTYTTAALINLTDTRVRSTNHGIYIGATTSGQSHGVGAIEINATDSSIESSTGHGIRVVGGESTLNLDHSTLEGAASMNAVNFQSVMAGDKLNINLTNQSVITGNVYSVGLVGVASGLTIAAEDSRLLGDMTATAESSINAKFADGSYWQGKGEYLAIGDQLNVELSNSTWDMTGDSLLTTLALNSSGTVNFQTSLVGGSYGTLTVDRLTGNGLFEMRTDLVGDGAGNNKGDLLVVMGNSAGNHQVTVQNNGSMSTTGTETLTIIETADGVASFVLTDAVELGGYEYLLRRTDADASNWELSTARQATSTGSASINSFGAGYLLSYAETQTLLQRMGDLRRNESSGEPTGNIWARAFGGKFTSSSDGFLSGFDMTYSGLQIGADKKRKWGNADVYLGAMFGFSHANQDFETGSGSISDRHIGLYGVYIQPSGFYVDSLVKYTKMDHDFKVLDTAGTRVTGDDMSTDGLSASVEIGQRIHLDRKSQEGWYVEPQAQISVGHQSGGSFNASNGLRVDVDNYTSTLGRLGLNVGYEVKTGKNPINVYAKTSYVHEFDGDIGYRFNGSREQTSFGDSWWTYGVGITAQLNQKHNIYLDIERASGGQFNQPWSVNGGYRFNW